MLRKIRREDKNEIKLKISKKDKNLYCLFIGYRSS